MPECTSLKNNQKHQTFWRAEFSGPSTQISSDLYVAKADAEKWIRFLMLHIAQACGNTELVSLINRVGIYDARREFWTHTRKGFRVWKEVI